MVGIGFSNPYELAAEQLISIAPAPTAANGSKTTPEDSDLEIQPPLSDTEEDMCSLALSFFHLRDYERAAWTLRDPIGINGEPASPSSGYTSTKALFIKLYAKFMAIIRASVTNNVAIWGQAGEQKKAIGQLGASELLTHVPAPNAKLHEILFELQKREEELDSFCLYLKGIVYSRLKLKHKASAALVRSLNKNQFNWSAWEELATLPDNGEELAIVIPQLPEGYMQKFFHVHLMAHRTLAADTFTQAKSDLEALFVNSNHLDLLTAVSYYNQGKYERALEYFEDYRQAEPLSLDFVDVQSHILFTMHEAAKLSVLAQKCVKLDRYRPETCIVAGNFFSARREHTQAVDFFQRALKLRPNHAEALIMMGDEYLELKNSNAALEAYRRAADIAPHDFRTWYGIGKAFDMLAMPDHALPYFQKAAACRPYHSQTWTAIGQAFQATGRRAQAMMSFKRALICTDRSPLLFYYIASLYEQSAQEEAYGKESDDRSQAAFYYKCWIEEYKRVVDKQQYYDDWEAAVTFLAEHYRARDDFVQAEIYANDIQHTERGKSLIREIRAIKGYTYNPISHNSSTASTAGNSTHRGNTPSVTSVASQSTGSSRNSTPAASHHHHLHLHPHNHHHQHHQQSQQPPPLTGPAFLAPAFDFPGGSSGEAWVSPSTSGRASGVGVGGGPLPHLAGTSNRTSRTGSRNTSGWNSPAVDDVR
ncbi:hypothetical protein PhCBS80983_g03025 [Powellomyces hirtus]|uniref:Cdc23 domain-containing protein n=1 Tax=Powellomyces hirtus TaxID=109895 RepID=A0A507E483_9FUNG|nr:hypothetical protein PhCBS80983_g03025 [Powellomyces hirtus]